MKAESICAVFCLLLTPLALLANAADTRCDHYAPLRTAFFGDLHVHTRYSLDASTQDTRTTPEQAYRFAQGEVIGLQPWSKNGEPGRTLALPRPLDFAMVSDHAELFGEVSICNDPGAPGFRSWQCLLYRYIPLGAYYLFNYKANIDAERLGFCGEDGDYCRQAAAGPWREMIEAARDASTTAPSCEFTAFVGYEWTGMDASTGGNLHRNVVFRNLEVPGLPFSFIEYPRAEDLWQGLLDQCRLRDNSCDALVIPHNANLSAGLMFPGVAAQTAERATLQASFERIMEIMQHKGSSECYFERGATRDELCAFEQLPVGSMMGDAPPTPTTGFAREILSKGLELQSSLAVNPYQLGFLASTDTHLGTPGAVEEAGFPGHGGAGSSARNEVPPGLPDNAAYNPGGLAVLWAEENTRESLFEALKRREVYGTSGPRISSRLFGGWDLDPDLCDLNDMVQHAYATGVPMGGVLPERPTPGAAPAFLVAATADPDGEVGLQRIQIIKGWRNSAGEIGETVYDLAGNPNNGAGVQPGSCRPTGTGASQLCSVWSDPAFDPDADAWYYSRVVENPTCRWSQRICVASGVRCDTPSTIGPGLEACCEPTHRPVIQERAWSSPIWYQRH